MAIIWLIENERTQVTYTWLIMAKYALRVFQSFPACLYNLRSTGRLPNLLVLNCHSDLDWTQLDTFQGKIGSIPLVAIGKNDHIPKGEIIHLSAAYTDQEILRELELHKKDVDPISTPLTFKDLKLRKEENAIFLEGVDEEISLTVVEAKILKLLMKNPSTHVSRNDLSAAIWGKIKVAPRTLDTHICRLRSKLSNSEAKITCHYATGYSIE